MKYVSIDIETLGLNPTCGIVEFGAVIDDLENPLPLESLPKFHVYVEQQQYQGEPFAMSMHSEILKRIATHEEGYNYCYPKHLGILFKKFLFDNGFESESQGKITINVAGKNFMGFDDRFLRHHTDLHEHIKFRSRVIDPGPLYYQPGDKVLPGLGECLKRAGYEPNVAHTSIEDALDVIKVIRKKYIVEA